ncbi:uncharacterized protein LOC108205922 isoform X3 [Daucus carota subsp. sativus]|uniref:uncharacterized protein LOC108205922 isoform X3 n=1 Tax=Daucus carota subsp. sativus TaxID=79200 RepID=UPI0007EF23D7|nr:PREDICTED: calponin homology domain-containing protein DDB_G0272472-like isoform X3 [Daucus carota subsp. sativus]
MTRNDVDSKPEIVSPATRISAPTTTFSPNASILDLILKLRSCFQLKDSEEVANILQCREDKLKQNITDLKNREDKLNMHNIELKSQLQALIEKCASLETRREKFAGEKGEIESELKKYKVECEGYKDKNHLVKYELEKVRLDLKMLKEREEMSVERYERRIVELEKEGKEERERLHVEVVKLREELENERVKGREELEKERVKGREELDKERVKGREEVEKVRGEVAGLIEGKRKAEESARCWKMRYEKCYPRVVKLEEELLVMLGNDPVLGKAVEKWIRSPPVINTKSAGNPELVERKKQSNVSKCNENTHASPCVASSADLPMVDIIGPAETGPNSSIMARAKRRPTQDQEVIKIDDSDDESPIVETASASKTDKGYGRSFEKDPVSQSISKGKHLSVCTQNYGDADGRNKNKKRKLDSPFPDKAENSSDSSDESITTVAIEKLLSKIPKNKPFNFDVDMLAAFDKDDELCLHAVCALHRLEKCDKLPQSQGFSAIDATRGSHLAKFLTNGDPKGKLQKSVDELQQYDSKGIDECRKLARNYYRQLFQMYKKEEDPLFKEYMFKKYPKKSMS